MALPLVSEFTMKLSLAVAASFSSASSRPRPTPVVRPTRVQTAPKNVAPRTTTLQLDVTP